MDKDEIIAKLVDLYDYTLDYYELAISYANAKDQIIGSDEMFRLKQELESKILEMQDILNEYDNVQKKNVN